MGEKKEMDLEDFAAMVVARASTVQLLRAASRPTSKSLICLKIRNLCISMKGLLLVCFILTAALLRASTKHVQRSPNTRLSEVEWDTYYDREENGPGTYSFGYDIDDAESGNTQFRQEERFLNGTVEGSYGLTEADGNVRVVHYTADHLGYRVRIKNSLRKNEDYPSRPVQQSPTPSWILQKQNTRSNLYPKVTPPEFVSNSIDISNTPIRVPLLSYYKGRFYPLFVNGPISRWILPNNFNSQQYTSYNNL